MMGRLKVVWNQQTHLTESSFFLKECIIVEYVEFVDLSAL